MIAIEWWEKARMNWRESITVVGGGTEVDPATLSDTEIVERVAKPRRMPAVLRAAKASGTVH
jgi:hypothetical protein